MTTYQLTIPGNPIPKARPRIVNGVAYTPERTADYEEVARNWAAIQWQREPLRGPLALRLTFWRRTRRRCDIDNLIKSALDALQGVVFVDDWQIVKLEATKGVNQWEPELNIEIEELPEW